MRHIRSTQGPARQRMFMAARPARGGSEETCYGRFPPASGKGVTGEPVTDGPSGPCNVRPGVLKDRSREESACEKGAV